MTGFLTIRTGFVITALFALVLSSPCLLEAQAPATPPDAPQAPPEAPPAEPAPPPGAAPSDPSPAPTEPIETEPPSVAPPPPPPPPEQPPATTPEAPPPPVEPVPAPSPPPSPAPTPPPPPPPEDVAPPPPQRESAREPIEVTIVGTRLSKTPGSAQIVRTKELERFEYDDPTAALLSVPGVYSRTEDGMGLRPNIGMRGVNPDRSKKVTLLEDGVLFGPAPYSAPAAYYFPMITRMTQVRVIKGPSAVAYGPQTVAGAIDLVTRSVPPAPGGGLDLAVGQFGYTKGHGYFGASNEQFGFLVEGVRLANTGFKELPNDGNTGITRNEWMAKFSYVIDPDADVRNEFRLKLSYSDEISNETYLGLSDADFEEDPYQRYGATELDRMKNHRFSTVLSHQVDFTPRMTLTTTAYRHAFVRSWRRVDTFAGRALFDVLENPEDDINAQYLDALEGEGDLSSISSTEALNLATNGRDFVSEGVQSLLQFQAETGQFAHRLEVGMRFHFDRIERRHTAESFDLFEGEPYPKGVPTTVTAFNKGATYALAPHVLYALTFHGLTVTPGMRAELMRMSFIDRATGDGSKSFNYALLPGVGLYYALTEEWGVLSGVYRGFSPAPPENAKEVDPEYSINYEAGTRYTDGPLRAEVIGFYNDYQNLTDYCTASGGGCPAEFLDQQASAGNAAIYGLEALAAHDVPAGALKIPLSVAYTFTHAEFEESFQSFDPVWGNVTKGDALPYVPEHQLRGSAGIDSKVAGGAVACTYVSAMREGKTGLGADARELRTDTQYIIDASAWAKVWGPFSLYATAQNLLDSAFLVARRPFGARPNAPRWVHVGLKASF